MLGSTFQALIVPSVAMPSAAAEANTLNDRGVQQWQARRRADALAALASAQRADPRFAVPYHNRGAVLLVEGHFAQAIPELQRAVEIAPQWALPREHLAQAYLRIGDIAQAVATSDQARALDSAMLDVRDEVRTLLQARLQVATAVAAKRRTAFIGSLIVAALISLVTAGIGLGALAFPIYRFTLFAQARHVREDTREHLRLLAAVPIRSPAAAVPVVAGSAHAAHPPPSGKVPYVAAGALPPFAASELDPLAPSGTGYRRAGWTLLLLALAATLAGAMALAASNGGLGIRLPAGLEDLLVGGALALFGIACLIAACLLTALALLAGAIAAFRRRRIGWGLIILVVGGVGTVLLLVPGQMVVLLYLLAMPHTPAERRVDADTAVPMPPMALDTGRA